MHLVVMKTPGPLWIMDALTPGTAARLAFCFWKRVSSSVTVTVTVP